MSDHWSRHNEACGCGSGPVSTCASRTPIPERVLQCCRHRCSRTQSLGFSEYVDAAAEAVAEFEAGASVSSSDCWARAVCAPHWRDCVLWTARQSAPARKRGKTWQQQAVHPQRSWKRSKQSSWRQRQVRWQANSCTLGASMLLLALVKSHVQHLELLCVPTWCWCP